MIPACLWAAQGQNIFQYEVPGYPAGDLSCQAEADALAARVQKATGVTIYKQNCVHDYKTSFDLSVAYVADQALPLESTFDHQQVDSQGTYLTLADCQAGLAAEAKFFQDSTGLTPVTAYCFDDEGAGAKYTYLARVEALGSTKVHAWSDNFLVDGRPLARLDEVAQSIQTALNHHGLRVEHVTIDNGIGFYRLGLHYYAAIKLNVDVRKLAVYRSEETCEGQIPVANQLFSSAAVEPMGVFCAEPDLRLDINLLVVTANPTHAYRAETAPDTYKTFDDCQNDKGRVLDFYRHSLQRDAFGAICDGYSEQYRVHVLERY
jgi:hypothetical protein